MLGVSWQTGQADLARAVYEGVAMAARLALQTLQRSADGASYSITCGGGGFQSEPWNQIRADVMGVALHRLAAQDPGVLGAAIITAVGTGGFAGFDEASAALAIFDKTYMPNQIAHAYYNDLFAPYQDAISTNADLGKRLSKLGVAFVS